MNRLTDPGEIRRLLDTYGFHFSKSMGQNFLIDASVPERIAESAEADRDCAVLEIGPGIGCLTSELSERAGKVISVELDRSLKPLLGETLSGCENTEVLFADVMKLDLEELIREKLTLPVKIVCANLPYNITTPLLTELIRTEQFERICVMIQKEVAERICARPGKKDYGAFSLFVQWYYEPELLFSVSPHCFMPQPKVTSAVIRLRKRSEPPAEVRDTELMFRIIRAAFNQRRKTLVNALSAALPQISKADCERILKLCDLDTNIRGEKLNLGDFARISNEIGNLDHVKL